MARTEQFGLRWTLSRLALVLASIDLPAAAVPADVHQPLAAIDLDPLGILRPVGIEVGAVPHFAVALDHVGRVERELEDERELVELGHTVTVDTTLPSNLDGYDAVFCLMGWYRC